MLFERSLGCAGAFGGGGGGGGGVGGVWGGVGGGGGGGGGGRFTQVYSKTQAHNPIALQHPVFDQGVQQRLLDI